MNILKVRDFISQCPALDPDAMIYVDLVDGSPINYGIQDNGPEVVSRDVTGKRTFRHRYVMYMQLASGKDSDRANNVINNHSFQRWLMDQDDAENYPEPEPGEAVLGMGAAAPLFVGYDTSASAAIYQLQFFITYEEDK